MLERKNREVEVFRPVYAIVLDIGGCTPTTWRPPPLKQGAVERPAREMRNSHPPPLATGMLSSSSRMPAPFNEYEADKLEHMRTVQEIAVSRSHMS